MKVSADGTGVYVGGELGGLIHLARSEEDGSLTMTRAWAASDFDEALQVYVTLRAEAMAQRTFLCAFNTVYLVVWQDTYTIAGIV